MREPAPLVGDPVWGRLSELLEARLGLHFPPERQSDLARGMDQAAQLFGQDSSRACAEWLLARPLSEERLQALMGCLTIGETYFFRDAGAFAALERCVLPALVRSRERTDRRLRLWSVGCSSGEEAYSMAIALARALPQPERWDVSVLATDVDTKALEKARLAVFGEWSLRATPPEVRERFFQPRADGRWQVDARIRASVAFACHNLAADDAFSPEKGLLGMDVIFCRNVLMYFSSAQAHRVAARMARCLSHDGWFFFAPAELGHVRCAALRQVTFPEAIVHCRAERRATQKPGPPSCRRVSVPAPPIPEPASPRRLQSPRADPAGLARAHADRGRLDAALRHCDEALAVGKLDAELWLLRGRILDEQRQDAPAASALRQAIFLDPENPVAYFRVGMLARRRGRSAEAARHLASASAILRACRPEQVFSGAEGLSAGRLLEILGAGVGSGRAA